MDPVTLRTDRLVLDGVTTADADLVAEYCADPVFERFMSTPWPYTRAHASGFIEEYVPQGWADGRECTWALRHADGGALLGVIGWRRQLSMVGFWLGAPHRGHGYMPEALTAVVDWVFATQPVDLMRWECVVGNAASASVARACGFRYTGTRAGRIPARDGRRTTSWHGELRRDDDRTPTSGWPV